MKLYEALIERDLDAIPGAASELSPHDLFVAVARFAVLAYAPSQHAKRAVMACRAAWELRDDYGDRWRAIVLECARYAAESRQPWSEPPILEGLAVPHEIELREKAKGDALLMLDTALALVPVLGEKGRAALLRMPVEEIEAGANDDDVDASLESLIDRAIEVNGAIDAVRDVFLAVAKARPAVQREPSNPPVYHLARDYAQTLIAYSLPLPETLRAPFLAAVQHNLAHGESFADWSFA